MYCFQSFHVHLIIVSLSARILFFVPLTTYRIFHLQIVFIMFYISSFVYLFIKFKQKKLKPPRSKKVPYSSPLAPSSLFLKVKKEDDLMIFQYSIAETHFDTGWIKSPTIILSMIKMDRYLQLKLLRNSR